MVQPQNFSFFLIFLVVLRGTAAPVLFQWLVSRDVSTGAPFYNGTIIPISTSLLLVSVLIQRFGLMRSPLEAKRIVSIRPNFREAHKNPFPLNPFLMKQPYYPGFFNPFFLDLFRQNQFLFPLFFGQSAFVSDRSGLSGTLSETSVALPLFFIIKFMGDFSYLESFCGVLCSLLFRTTFFLFQFHRRLAARHKLYLFLVFHKQRRRKLISSLRSKNSFLVRALPSRLVTFRKAPPPVNMKISHGGVCIFIMGVILSNARKIQFTGKTPLGSELHIGKVRSTSRGIDQLHGPTFHSICGNLIIYKPIAWITGSSPGEFVAKARSGPEMGTRVLEQNSFSHWLTMFPEKRFYFSNQETSITKVAIDTNLFTDLYALIGTGSFETGWYTTVIKLPFIFRIWIGFIMASLGGLLSPFRKLTSTDWIIKFL
nr:cytochrome c biogenesis factor C [Apopellia endiviifolia]WIA66569.1 cytochrome c biogenesis factor C [Apopellia endiviifolia]